MDDLMQRLARGDRSAFDRVYAEARPLLERFTARALGGGADAEDAAQQALLQVFSRASEYQPGRSAAAWMLGIAAYEVRTARKRRARRRESPLTAVEVDGRACAAPTPEERSVLADLEAAARAGIAPATFRKRLQRALERARLLWRTRHGHD